MLKDRRYDVTSADTFHARVYASSHTEAGIEALSDFIMSAEYREQKCPHSMLLVFDGSDYQTFETDTLLAEIQLRVCPESETVLSLDAIRRQQDELRIEATGLEPDLREEITKEEGSNGWTMSFLGYFEKSVHSLLGLSVNSIEFDAAQSADTVVKSRAVLQAQTALIQSRGDLKTGTMLRQHRDAENLERCKEMVATSDALKSRTDSDEAIVVVAHPPLYGDERDMYWGIGRVIHVEPPGPIARSRVKTHATDYAEQSVLPLIRISEKAWFDPEFNPLPRPGQFVAYEEEFATPILNMRSMRGYLKVSDEIFSEQVRAEHDLQYDRLGCPVRPEVVVKTRDFTGIGTIHAVFPDPAREIDEATSAAAKLSSRRDGWYYHVVNWMESDRDPVAGAEVEYDPELCMASALGNLRGHIEEWTVDAFNMQPEPEHGQARSRKQSEPSQEHDIDC